jgi:alkylated DNA repair dioxygenase AlkB
MNRTARASPMLRPHDTPCRRACQGASRLTAVHTTISNSCASPYAREMHARETIALDDEHSLFIGVLPAHLVPNATEFDALWALHPDTFHEIVMHGKKVRTPRWQQAYGADYAYTGRVNRALPMTPEMERWLAWAREEIEPKLNGLLFNWYDGRSGHYIGKHRDSDVNRIEGTPIVTLSFGEPRVFRVRRVARARGKFEAGSVRSGSDQRLERGVSGALSGPPIVTDVPAIDGGVIVMPWAVNRAFTHEVPARRGATGRRISVTLRAFRT